MNTTTTSQNDITTVRTALFDTLRGLSRKGNPLDIDRAKAINEVAQTIINSAKVEIDALRVIGGTGSGFIPAPPPEKPNTNPKPKPALLNISNSGDDDISKPRISHPAPGVTRHTLK